MSGTVLILGANGRFGRNAAEAFWNAGWRVTLFDRAKDDLQALAQGMDVIVNGLNPAYPDWEATVPKLTHQVISAARTSGATVVIPGNIYVFGQGSNPVLDETTPQNAQNLLGRIRIEMEAAYRAADIPVILLRAGDFIDTEASEGWLDKVMTASLNKGKFTYPGDADTPHAWAYLPDMARAAVALCEQRHSLPRFADIAFPGYTLTGRDMAALCGQSVQKPITLKSMNWLPIRLAQPFWPLAKHLLEMRYLWDMPHQLAPDQFNRLLPGFVQTNPAEAIAKAISHTTETGGQPKQGDGVRHQATPA